MKAGIFLSMAAGALVQCRPLELIGTCDGCHGDVDSAQVYGTPFSISAHYLPSGYMGDGAVPGLSAIRVADKLQAVSYAANRDRFVSRMEYRPSRDSGWGGVCWQYPASNWGAKRGLTIGRVRSCTFWAKGETGRELVSFQAANLAGPAGGREGLGASLGIIRLSSAWRKYSIPILSDTLANLAGAFSWSARQKGNPPVIGFQVDDIAFVADSTPGLPDTLTPPVDVQAYFDPSERSGDAAVANQAWVALDENDPGGARPGDPDGITTRIRYATGPDRYASISWVAIPGNAGRFPGKALKGSRRLAFWCRSGGDTLVIQFKSGSSRPLSPYPDSFAASLGFVTVGPAWKEYALDLAGSDLSNVQTAFTLTLEGKPGATVELHCDGIRFE